MTNNLPLESIEFPTGYSDAYKLGDTLRDAGVAGCLVDHYIRQTLELDLATSELSGALGGLSMATEQAVANLKFDFAVDPGFVAQYADKVAAAAQRRTWAAATTQQAIYLIRNV